MEKNPEQNKETQKGSVSGKIDAGRILLSLLNSLPYYVMLVDEDHHILLANQAVLTELEVDPESALGSYCPQLVHGVDRPVPDCPVEEAVETQGFVERECFSPKTGQWFKSIASPLEDISSSEKTVFLHYIQDISAQKRVEKEKEHAAIEERARIARDMHDGVLQSLYSLGIKTDICRRLLLNEEEIGEVVRELEELKENLQDNIEEARRVIFGLKPFEADQEIVETLRNLTSEFEAHSRVGTELEAKGEIPHLPAQIKYILFRVAQEALANVGRHSKAENARVIVNLPHPEEVHLEIRDNGQGFENSKLAPGMGIKNMTERIEEMGGSLEIVSAPEKGTTVKATLPLARGFE